MSPYEILGIRPTASRDEAEAAYRALMRECHPDLHLHAGPEAVAWAEQQTRHLNAAIRAIRTEDRVFVGTAGEQFARDHGFRATDDTDWFGNPTRPRITITCVMCGLQTRGARRSTACTCCSTTPLRSKCASISFERCDRRGSR